MSNTTRTAEQICQDIANLEGELSALAGEGLILRDSNGNTFAEAPEGGAILEIDYATDTFASLTWYATTEQAKAALAKLARDRHETPDEDGFSVDLTAPGCHSSSARITRL